MRNEITEEVDLMRAEIERLNKDLLAQNACCDGAAAQDAHVRREREEHRAENERLREENEMLIVTVTMIERMAAGAIYSQEAIHASAIGALKQLGGKP